MEKMSITCRLDKNEVMFLDKLAQVTDRDRSYLIKQAVSDYIATHRWQIEEVEAALAEAASGNLLTEQEFYANMKTW